jgi:DNA-binding response OmpR family regulator
MKILVIDDDEPMRRMVETVLRTDGHDVVTAENGLRGMAMLSEERPQIVVTDIIMPEQEGIETILALRRGNPDIRIIAISGGDTIGGTEVLKMAQLLGANEVLQKPFRAHDLIARVHALDTSRSVAGGDPA